MINVSEQLRTEKPPEYETCVMAPPSYDDALQLNASAFLHSAVYKEAAPSYESQTIVPSIICHDCTMTTANTEAASTSSRVSSNKILETVVVVR